MTGAPGWPRWSRATWPGAATVVRAVVVRTLVGAAAWWALVEGDTSVLGYGLAVVPLFVVLGLLVSGPPSPSRGHLLRRVGAGVRLAGWVLARSFTGGVDVARRAVTPRVDTDPYWTSYTTSLPDEGARVLLVLVMNLLPGSLSASLRGDHVDVHVIGPELDVHGSLAELERRLAAVLGSD